MKIFMDMEFTGLHQYTTVVSIGLVNEYGDTFYAEFTDYDENQVDGWLVDNVLDNLYLTEANEFPGNDKLNVKVRGDVRLVRRHMDNWFDETLINHEEKRIEMWGDCLAYDWVLFCQLYGHSFNTPYYIYYIPFDICTLFKLAGVNPDINREEFAGCKDTDNKHNSLHDAKVIKMCYDKISNMITILKK
jgi:hypothetical protein